MLKNDELRGMGKTYRSKELAKSDFNICCNNFAPKLSHFVTLKKTTYNSFSMFEEGSAPSRCNELQHIPFDFTLQTIKRY